MFAGWFIKVVVHIFLVSDSCQPPVPTATTWNIVLTLTLDCGRHHRTRGEHTTPQIPGVFSPTSSCNAPVTSQRADRVQTQSIQGSLALFSICALSHMNACPQNVQKGRKEKKGTRQRHKQTVDLMASQQLLRRFWQTASAC